MLPRTVKADTDSLLSTDGNPFDAGAISKIVLQGGKSGSYGDRA